jgi:anti-anti-sigma regulatory factor
MSTQDHRSDGMSALEVRHRRDDGHTTISLEGELESSDGPGRIVIDLRGLRFMDSTGLRLLVTADLRLRRDGRELALVPGPEAVHRVFRLALLEERLVFVEQGAGSGAPP